jgi:integrase
MTPASVAPPHIGKYLDLGVELGRPVRANREKACLSSCFTWLIRTGEGGITQNPCIGVKRNTERARERYIEDWEFNKVMAKATSPQAKAVAGLIYRTLQRPIDILRWTAANIVYKAVDGGEERVLRFRQSKTGAQLEICVTHEIDEYLRWAAGDGKKVTGMTLIHTGRGQPYAEKSVSGMWGTYVRACDGIKDFGIYDLKGKGATDMWLTGVPLEQIQALCGHESITTTEIYVKSRWRGTIEPNRRVVGE